MALRLLRQALGRTSTTAANSVVPAALRSLSTSWTARALSTPPSIRKEMRIRLLMPDFPPMIAETTEEYHVLGAIGHGWTQEVITTCTIELFSIDHRSEIARNYLTRGIRFRIPVQWRTISHSLFAVACLTESTGQKPWNRNAWLAHLSYA